MAQEITVTDHDYDDLKIRAGSDAKIRFVVANLLKLSNQAAIELYKFEKWKEAVEGTGAKPPSPPRQV